MKTQATVNRQGSETEKTESVKRGYQKPRLRTYGRLVDWTQGTGGTVGDAGAQTMLRSDRQRKTNIVRIGDHPLGIGLYLFDYKPEFRDSCGHGRQFGVMADEVEQVLPQAVSAHANGYKMVNYGLLGIDRNPN